MNIAELSEKELRSLRGEIVLNSLYKRDYDNSLGVEADECIEFFDAYFDWLLDTYGDDGWGMPDHEETEDDLLAFSKLWWGIEG